MSGNGWVGPERRKERAKKKSTRIKMSSTPSFFIQQLERVVSCLHAFREGRNLYKDLIDSVISALKIVYREFLAKSCTEDLDDLEQEASQCVLSALQILYDVYDSVLSDVESRENYPVTHTGVVGRPKFSISREQIEFLVESLFAKIGAIRRAWVF